MQPPNEPPYQPPQQAPIPSPYAPPTAGGAVPPQGPAQVNFDVISRAWELLKPNLTAARGEIRYEALAAELGIEPASVRSAVHRLRKRFREIFREEIAGTVADPREVDDEMRAVIAALSSD